MLKNTLTARETKDNCAIKKELADTARTQYLSQNLYRADCPYTAQHKNAKMEAGGKGDPLNKKGKGTGSYMDTENGGGRCDIKGVPELTYSGRERLLSINRFNKNNKYDPNLCNGDI